LRVIFAGFSLQRPNFLVGHDALAPAVCDDPVFRERKALRMIHYWINIDGAQTYLRVLPLGRPLSTLVVAFTVLLRLSLICLAAIGAYTVWLRGRSPLTDQMLLARFAAFFVLMRTVELGALRTVAWAGLMEVRYVVIVFPFVILLSLWGVRFLFQNARQRKPQSMVCSTRSTASMRNA
jgi:hypothetical protein